MNISDSFQPKKPKISDCFFNRLVFSLTHFDWKLKFCFFIISYCFFFFSSFLSLWNYQGARFFWFWFWIFVLYIILAIIFSVYLGMKGVIISLVRLIQGLSSIFSNLDLLILGSAIRSLSSGNWIKDDFVFWEFCYLCCNKMKLSFEESFYFENLCTGFTFWVFPKLCSSAPSGHWNFVK